MFFDLTSTDVKHLLLQRMAQADCLPVWRALWNTLQVLVQVFKRIAPRAKDGERLVIGHGRPIGGVWAILLEDLNLELHGMEHWHASAG